MHRTIRSLITACIHFITHRVPLDRRVRTFQTDACQDLVGITLWIQPNFGQVFMENERLSIMQPVQFRMCIHGQYSDRCHGCFVLLHVLVGVLVLHRMVRRPYIVQRGQEQLLSFFVVVVQIIRLLGAIGQTFEFIKPIQGNHTPFFGQQLVEHRFFSH